MIPAKAKAVNQYFGPGRFWKILIPLSIALLALLALLGNAVSAQDTRPENAIGYYTRDGEVHWIILGGAIDVDHLGNLSPSELEALYPLSTGDEKTIVHQVPLCPVIIDGVTYKPEDISLFNGIRLRFVMGDDDTLYAFTTAKGLEKFQQEHGKTTLLDDPDSVFYKDWWYTGERFGLVPGCGFPVLSQIYIDNAVSSVQVSTLASWAYLYDYTWYGGDYFAMESGSDHYMLSLEGWNDRASSAYVFP